MHESFNARIAFVILLTICVGCALAIPTPFNYKLPPEFSKLDAWEVKTYLKPLKEPFKEAKTQITKMKETIDCAMDKKNPQHAACLYDVQKVFTPHCKIENLSRLVNLMAAAKAELPVLSYKAALRPKQIAFTRVSGGKSDGLTVGIMFYHNEYRQWERVMTLVHEASHYFAGTLDLWEFNTEHTKLFPVHERSPSVRIVGEGYWVNQVVYRDIVSMSPELLFKNADTWAVFGHFVTHRELPSIILDPPFPHHYPSVERLRPPPGPVWDDRKPGRRLSFTV